MNDAQRLRGKKPTRDSYSVDGFNSGTDWNLQHPAMGLHRAFGRAQYVGDLVVGLARKPLARKAST